MGKQVIKDALWVDVGDYTVLRNGRIFKRNWNHTGKTREVRQTLRPNGYLKFQCGGKTISSHRFIADAFVSNPDSLPQINHKDECKENNSALNLEWCDARYNNGYGTRNKRISKTKTNGKKSKKVYQYTLDGELVREWPSVSEIGRQVGYRKGCISDCCLGKQKTAYGFIWRYDPI